MVNKIIIPSVIAAIIASASGAAYYYDLDDDSGSPDINFDSTSSNQLEIHFIDVGQGDSTLLITPNDYVILVDGGNNGKGHGVAQYIHSLGINTIDLMIATHPDADHIGGLDEVIQIITVNQVLDNDQAHPDSTDTYQDHMNAIENISRIIASKDLLLPISTVGAEIEIIVPFDNDRGMYADTNANSVLVKATYGGTSVLLTGDCEKKCEKKLLEDDIDNDIGNDIDVDILKVGHHGSSSSTTEEFLTIVSPEFAIISVGNNQWDLPKTEILTRLSDFGIDTYRTDESGTIVVTIDENGNSLIGLSNN